jgi:hypothetical protein
VLKIKVILVYIIKMKRSYLTNILIVKNAKKNKKNSIENMKVKDLLTGYVIDAVI